MSTLEQKSVSLDKIEIYTIAQAANVFGNAGRRGDTRSKLFRELIDAINRIDIYEDLYKPGLTGQVYFRDSLSLSTVAEMRGLDFLGLEFSMKDPESNNLRKFNQLVTETDSNGRVTEQRRPFVFAIYNQTDRIPTEKNMEEYSLGICSPELITSVERKISRSYKGKYPSEIIRDIIQSPYGVNSKKIFKTLEQSKSQVTVVVPYMRPMEVIQLLTLQGQAGNGSTNYLFYETLEGYHFVSFKQMLRQAKTNAIIPLIYTDLAGSTGGDRNTTRRMKAEQLHIVSGFDLMYATARGYFASTTIAPDVLSGRCALEVTGAGSDRAASTFRDALGHPRSTRAAKAWDTGIGRPNYSSREKINTNGVDFYPTEMSEFASPTARTFLVPTTGLSAANTLLTRLDPSISDNFIAQTLADRNRELLGLQFRTIRGVVSGAPELHPGQLIDVDFPAPLSNKNSKIWDYASGRYLIVNAKHSIIGLGDRTFMYETTFEAVTDSFASHRPS